MGTLDRSRATVAALCASLALLAAACGDDAEPGAAVTDAKTAAGSQAVTEGGPAEIDLVVRWWNWAAAEPEATNPVTDVDGSFCAANQPTDVWFLAATFGDEVVRGCAIPPGRQIFVPVLNQVCSPDVVCSLDDVTVTATLDGEPVPILRVTNGVFSVSGAVENPISFEVGPVELVSTGLWVRVGPLAAGEHTLVLAGSQPNGFASKVTYALQAG